MKRIKLCKWLCATAVCTLGMALHSSECGAIEYDSIALRYKNENAVITNYTRHMVVSCEQGKLVASSYITKEKLLISDLGPKLHHTDYLFFSDLNIITNAKATASLPVKNGYRMVPCNNFAVINPDRDNVFYDDSRYEVVSYSGLVKNAITETQYAVEHTDLNMLPPFAFQDELPIVDATFEITVPKYVQIKFAQRGSEDVHIYETEEEHPGTVTYRFTASNIPAYKEYSNVPSIWYYVPHVIPYITSYKLANAKKPVEMLGTTDLLYKYLYQYVRNLNMKNDTDLEKTVKKITKGDVLPEEKAAHIYKWVQTNMHYIAFEAGQEGFVPREAALVLKRKYGDCKDMTAILVTMCRKAGLDAYYAWIGTRDKPYTSGETPLPLINNHMICAVQLNDGWVYLDATHPTVPFGEAPAGIQGKEAMIAIDADHYLIKTMREAAPDKNVVTDSTFISFTGRDLAGSVKQYYKGYKAWDIGVMIQFYANEERDKAIKLLVKRGSDKYKQKKYVAYAGKTSAKDATVEADFTVADYVQKAGKQYYLNMNLVRTFGDRHIDGTGRDVPYYEDYRQRRKEVVMLNIPKGYRVVHVPKPVHGAADGLWNYTITYKTAKGKIILVKEYELNTMAVSPAQFTANNKLVDDLNKAYKESVVLTAN